MYRYAWCVPSASNVYPDISLFDHSRVTAALAVCLYEHPKWARERLPGISPERLRQLEDTEPFLLVKGEISGIQSYIYRIVRTGTGGIAKRLRGRSFYLQMFNHQVARLLLHRLGLTLAHLIYCGGGSFLMVLPNTEPVRDQLQQLVEEVEDYLWAHHLGELKFRLADKPLSPKAVFLGLSEALQDLELRLTQVRYRHFKALFRENRAVEREKPWESIRPCPSCRIQVVESGAELCETCETQQQRIGARLPRTGGAIFSADTLPTGPPEIGVDWKKLGKTRLADVEALYAAYGPETMESVTFNRPDRIPKTSLLFVANVVPKNESSREITVPTERDDEENPEGIVQRHQTFSFSTIAAWSEGDARLGILRMDADRMGAIIAQGLDHHGLMSFSRMATLSRQLQVFFEGWLRNICEDYTVQEWRPKVREERILCDYADAIQSIFYVVYSGGDDLFIIGPWSEILPLALRIRDDYRRFTCENPDMTLSAGVIVCKPKFPIPAMARLSGEAEDRSKVRGRNRITAFGTTVPWESTDGEWGLRELLGLAEQWTRWIRDDKVPRRFFHELLRLQAQAVSDDAVVRGMWIPRLIYRIHRNIPDEAIAAELHHILLGRPNSLALLRVVRVPASIALLKTRS
ncbi:CRISPR-associated protein Cas10/Csm1 [bacterium HR11]|nr:CRISPR-associated protein Cas10/Csm1 [bacterium HR11]